MPHTHQHQLSHLPKTLICHTCYLLSLTPSHHGLSRVFLHRMTCPAIPTLGLSHTHIAYVTFPQSHTESVKHHQESLHPHPSQGFKHQQDPQLFHQSWLPPLPSHTHKQPSSLPIYHTHTSVSHHASHIQTVTHVICVTQTVATPLLKHSLLPMFRGFQSGCQPEVPHLQFHVLSDKKIS